MVHPDAERRAREHLGHLKERAPGLVVALHVVGSSVLDDYQPGRSDLDVIGELGRPPTGPDIDALRAIHSGDASVEAVYLPTGQLNGPVESVTGALWSLDGELHTGEPCFQINPVTWQQLAEHQGTVLGDPPKPVYAPAEVAAFCVANLAEYWEPVLVQVTQGVHDRADDDAVNADTVVWVALGPARLWHTIRTGEVVSKSRAGQLAAAYWPDVAEPLTDVQAVRAGAGRPLTARHARVAVELGRRIMTDVQAPVATD